MTIHYDELTDQYWIASDDGPLFFNSPLEAKDALRSIEIEAAINAEIASIAAWFKRIGMTQAAMAIEAGDYKRG